MQALQRLAKGFYLATQIVGSVGLIGLMLVVGGTVVYRWFGGTFQGSYEVAEVFTIVTIAIAIFMATVNRSHVDVRIVYDRFSHGVRRALMSALLLAAAVFWAVTAYSTYLLVARLSRRGEITDVLRINLIPFRWVIVIGFVAVTLVLLYQAMMWATGRGNDGPQHDPADDYQGSENQHGS